MTTNERKFIIETDGETWPDSIGCTRQISRVCTDLYAT